MDHPFCISIFATNIRAYGYGAPIAICHAGKSFAPNLAGACPRLLPYRQQVNVGRDSVMDAISYKRFSSPKQGKGDSHRRQTDLTEEYCKRHELRLIDTYLDAGLSGFTGEN